MQWTSGRTAACFIDYQVSLNDKTVKHDGRLGCDSTQIP